MHNRGLTLLEIVAVVVLIAVLAALLVPGTHGHRHNWRQLSCSNNLQQLYKLGTIYATSHRGAWPETTGENLWLSFAKMNPPLIEPDHADLLHCEIADQELGPLETNYRGPGLPWKQLSGKDPLGADREDNHGEGYGGNVLFKDGSVLEYGSSDPLWQNCRVVLSP